MKRWKSAGLVLLFSIKIGFSAIYRDRLHTFEVWKLTVFGLKFGLHSTHRHRRRSVEINSPGNSDFKPVFLHQNKPSSVLYRATWHSA